MLRSSFSIIILFFLSFSSLKSMEVCTEELVAVAIEIAKLSVELEDLLDEMRALDSNLKEITTDLDRITKSEGMTFGNTMGVTLLGTQIFEDKGRIMHASGINAKSRLNYLKASLVRLNFSFKQKEQEALVRFGFGR